MALIDSSLCTKSVARLLVTLELGEFAVSPIALLQNVLEVFVKTASWKIKLFIRRPGLEWSHFSEKFLSIGVIVERANQERAIWKQENVVLLTISILNSNNQPTHQQAIEKPKQRYLEHLFEDCVLFNKVLMRQETGPKTGKLTLRFEVKKQVVLLFWYLI